ncbi:hypothetical protein [Fimbriiglobus ruber]|uniref:Squalene--hopene cyclase n=1 Tax=Fimbriiglobus ruber TaxID=1908690 RepID=A0A225E0A0_9BACT|nr:hypothetical protein [Fimbriiglobus ruber]OWK47170.1 hypothetical protein FRUB_00869 [Fimbriiglobus ruber]
MSRLATFLISASLLAPLTSVTAAPDDPPANTGGIDRTEKTKKRLLKEFGGSEESEEAVMLGLAWLTQMQRPEGNWVYDQGKVDDKAAATGMALLAFLGAGQSHQAGRYKQTVRAALDWLLKNIDKSQGDSRGQFAMITNMYSQGIATLALCEAYGMTQDKDLRGTAQAAIEYIQRAQGENGSWGYQYGGQGDNSIVGWQLQALHAAQLAHLNVDGKVIKKAIGFLNFSASGEHKENYGYTAPDGAPATSLSAVGLLSRYYADGWRAKNPGFAAGAKGLMQRAPSAAPDKPPLDVYYYYYATQVVRFYGGNEWTTWNEGTPKSGGAPRKSGMQDWLIERQVRTPDDRGSWDPPQGDPQIAPNCGRLGTTALCLLTLEVYYRYDPSEKVKPSGK